MPELGDPKPITLGEWVRNATVRGDAPEPAGHTADLVFFKVALAGAGVTPDEFLELSRSHEGEFGPCDPFDGQEHGFIELGGWLGDQGLALQYMGLGALLGVFELLTPRTMLGLPDGDPLALRMAGAGYVTVKARSRPRHAAGTPPARPRLPRGAGRQGRDGGRDPS